VDGGAKGEALEDSRSDLAAIGFLARRGDGALARTPPIQLCLNVGLAQGQPRRTAIYHHPHCPTVGLAVGSNRKQDAEGVAVGHGIPKQEAVTRRRLGETVFYSALGEWRAVRCSWRQPAIPRNTRWGSQRSSGSSGPK